MHACRHRVLPSLVIIPNQKQKQKLEYTKGRQKQTKESQLTINMYGCHLWGWLSFQTNSKDESKERRTERESTCIDGCPLVITWDHSLIPHTCIWANSCVNISPPYKYHLPVDSSCVCTEWIKLQANCDTRHLPNNTGTRAPDTQDSL